MCRRILFYGVGRFGFGFRTMLPFRQRFCSLQLFPLPIAGHGFKLRRWPRLPPKENSCMSDAVNDMTPACGLRRDLILKMSLCKKKLDNHLIIKSFAVPPQGVIYNY